MTLQDIDVTRSLASSVFAAAYMLRTIGELGAADSSAHKQRERDLTRHGFAKKYADAAIAAARGLNALVCTTLYLKYKSYTDSSPCSQCDYLRMPDACYHVQTCRTTASLQPKAERLLLTRSEADAVNFSENLRNDDPQVSR
jgi:hypothetical protein